MMISSFDLLLGNFLKFVQEHPYEEPSTLPIQIAAHCELWVGYRESGCVVGGSIFAGEADQCCLQPRNTNGGRHDITFAAVKSVITVYAWVSALAHASGPGPRRRSTFLQIQEIRT
jgi:hypothetical protein